MRHNIGPSIDAVIYVGNLLHCSPSRTQNDIFSYLGRPQASDSAVRNGSLGLLRAGAWIAVYGAFMKDDGGFASEGDEKVYHLLPLLLHLGRLADPLGTVSPALHGSSPRIWTSPDSRRRERGRAIRIQVGETITDACWELDDLLPSGGGLTSRAHKARGTGRAMALKGSLRYASPRSEFDLVESFDSGTHTDKQSMYDSYFALAVDWTPLAQAPMGL